MSLATTDHLDIPTDWLEGCEQISVGEHVAILLSVNLSLIFIDIGSCNSGYTPDPGKSQRKYISNASGYLISSSQVLVKGSET